MIRTPNGTNLTAHAVEAMLARDVSLTDVDRVLADPEQTYPCGPDRTVHQRGDLAVLVGSDATVITVLYRLQERWTDQHRRPSGRRVSKLAQRRLAAELRRVRGAAS